VAPEGEVEQAIAAIWAELLGVERIGRHDNFFELGGHSLMAVRTLSHLRARHGLEVPLAGIFSHPVLREFAGNAVAIARPAAPAIPPAPRGARRTPSFAQQRLWFLSQLSGGSAAYHIPLAFSLTGRLDRAALARALNAIVARHEALRTTFDAVDGEPLVAIAPESQPFALRYEDLSAGPDGPETAARLMRAEAAQPFDLARGPLVRGLLARTGEHSHTLMITMHHIVSDGWSLAVFTSELGRLYREAAGGQAAALAPLPLQYADYAAWQREQLSGALLAEQGAYWRDALANAPTLLELPCDHRRPAEQDFRGADLALDLGPDLSKALAGLAQRHGVSLYMAVLAGWAVVLSRLSGQQQVVIGTPVANRGRLELEGLIGFFANTLALPIEVDITRSPADLLTQVRKVVLDAQAHQDLPFEQIVELVQPARSVAHTPIFQTLFAWDNNDRIELALDGLGCALQPGVDTVAKFDLTLALGVVDGSIAGALNFATALFERETVERFAAYLRQTLQHMVDDSRQAFAAQAMATPAEQRKLLVDWNDTAVAYDDQRCIHTLLEARAALAPHATAVEYEGQLLSYGALHAQASQLARHLRAQGVRAGDRVGICVVRAPEMVIGLLAILKAGAAYVPLDPDNPPERLGFMLADAAPAVVLAHAATATVLSAALGALQRRPAVIDLVADSAAWRHLSDADPDCAEVGVGSRDLAYIIYTSGSTGMPKGVMIEHHALVNRLQWMQRAYRLNADDAVLQKTPFGFDVSVWEFFWPLLTGARLVLARPHGHKDPAYLCDLIRRKQITTLHFVPSMLPLFLGSAEAARCDSLRNVFCSGEELPAAAVNHFQRTYRHAALHNLYGPTEATVDVTAWHCTPLAPDAAVPIGRPIDNTRTYILDRAMQPVPVGVVGELYLGGAGIARGYLNRPELTAQRFLSSPFVAGDRLYRTGDLARYRADGNIDYLGRNDFQVKLRGFRIELGEIETRLRALPAVREAVVLAREDEAGDKRLVAYYVSRDGGDADPAQLAAALARDLPDYMVPSSYLRLEAMPLTNNGKLDRHALPAPSAAGYGCRQYQEPLGEVEQTLAAIWAAALDLPQVGRDDHFFELGGHSLLAVRVLERMRHARLYTDVRAFFATPVLRDLAAQLSRGERDDAIPANGIPAGATRLTPEMLTLVSLPQEHIDRIVAAVDGGAANVQDIYPLAPLQEGVLFHYLMSQDSDPYLMWNLSSFDDRAALERYAGALQRAIDRHDILRTSLVWEGLDEPLQVVWRAAPLLMEEVALGAAAADVAAALVARVNPRAMRIDLQRAPLTRLYVAYDPRQQRWLALRVIHHLIDDATSAQLLNREIERQLRGDAAPGPAPAAFRDFIAHARAPGQAQAHQQYFTRLLGQVEEPTAPFGLHDVHGDGTAIGEVHQALPSQLAARMRATARRLGVSTASVVHVAWGMLVARASGRADPVFGTVLFGRMQGMGGADSVLGPFINTLPVLIPLSQHSVEQCVRATQRQLAELMSHEQASLALAQRCSAVPPPAPLFTALLNYRHRLDTVLDDDAPATTAGVEIAAEERTNYPLVLNFDDLGQECRLNVQAVGGIDPERVCGMMQQALAVLVEALDAAPATPVAALDVLSGAERQCVVSAWNDTDAPYARQRCIHELMEAQVARAPAAPALMFGEQTLSYA
ncbi:amino acid adenylation domain-containing protein, partial [Rugamonas sp. A1-17]|nr:amino acid adenylation domain-containing protein [Rugamonas sp. A1-17]